MDHEGRRIEDNNRKGRQKGRAIESNKKEKITSRALLECGNTIPKELPSFPTGRRGEERE